jgi:hypothetical protein
MALVWLFFVLLKGGPQGVFGILDTPCSKTRDVPLTKRDKASSLEMNKLQATMNALSAFVVGVFPHRTLSTTSADSAFVVATKDSPQGTHYSSLPH